MKPALMLLVVGLMLAGCLPTAAISRFETVEPLIEAQVDAVIEFNNKRLCALPVDVLIRQRSEMGKDWFEGWKLMCPKAKELFE